MPLQTKEDFTDDETFCFSNLSYLDLSNVDEYHLAYSCTEDAIDTLRHSLIVRVSLIEKCACRAISSDFNTAHKKICVSSDTKMRFF